MLLLAEFLGVGFFGGRGLNRLGLIGAGSAVDKTWLDIDVGVLAQLGEISAESRLKLLVVKSVLNLREGVFHRRDASLLVINDFQDAVALLKAHYLGDLTSLHGKSFVLDFLCQLAALEHA